MRDVVNEEEFTILTVSSPFWHGVGNVNCRYDGYDLRHAISKNTVRRHLIKILEYWSDTFRALCNFGLEWENPIHSDSWISLSHAKGIQYEELLENLTNALIRSSG